MKELSAYALPDGARTAPRFTLRRQCDAAERGATYSFQPAPDFAPIARACELPLAMTGDEIVETGRSLASCRLFVNHKHGVGGRAETKHGVPDLDTMAAFRRAQDVLAPWGFRPWEGLAEIRTGKRAMKDRNQKWRDRDEDEDGRDAFEWWQEEAKADIAACYDGDTPHQSAVVKDLLPTLQAAGVTDTERWHLELIRRRGRLAPEELKLAA